MIEVDVWITANFMIEKHGPDAAIHAALRADEMLDQGNRAGAAAWQEVMRRIEVLQCMTPPGPTN